VIACGMAKSRSIGSSRPPSLSGRAGGAGGFRYHAPRDARPGLRDWAQPTQLASKPPRVRAKPSRSVLLVGCGVVLTIVLVAVLVFAFSGIPRKHCVGAHDRGHRRHCRTGRCRRCCRSGRSRDPRNIAVDPAGNVYLVTHSPRGY
jgi:hypothetical protein